MRGPLRRLRPDWAGPPESVEDETRTLPAVEPERVAPAPAAPAEGHAVPAGVAPEDLVGDAPDTRRRSRLRRRLRHLRQVRELMLRDAGGLAYELHRAPVDDAARTRGTAVVAQKLDRLVALDAERRELEVRLGDVRAQTVLREPGIGGACPACGEYFASHARFCSACGSRVDGRGAPAPAPAEFAPAAPAPAAEPASEPVPDPAPIEAPTEVRT